MAATSRSIYHGKGHQPRSPDHTPVDAGQRVGRARAEWESYERDRLALQDARGALTMAHRLGLERGRREGRAEGEAKGKAEAVLAARGLEVAEEQRERILSATSVAVLEGWLRQAVSATSTVDLFF
jgi:hypothetical protein